MSMWSNWNSRILFMRRQNDTVILENSLTVSWKLNVTYHMTQKFNSWLLSLEKWKFTFIPRPVHKCLQLLYLQLPQTSSNTNELHPTFSKRIDEHPYTGILHDNKKIHIVFQAYTWINFNDILSEKNQSHNVKHDSIYMKHTEGKYSSGEQISDW